ncbi:MAG: hypothetical protein MJ074_07635 [Oscillospiraceae bacterium]|nr:hypothetical protein [Oscillospiraceae bacterium]
MRTVYASRVGGSLYLGKRGTNETTRVLFPMEEGMDEIAVLHKRVGDEHPYAVPVSITAGGVEWVIGLADTAVAGTGVAEVIYKSGGKVAKSVTYTTRCDESIDDGEIIVPTAAESWVQHVAELTASAQLAERGAEAAAEVAVDCKDDAQDAAQRALRDAQDARTSEVMAERSASAADGAAQASNATAKEARVYASNAEQAANRAAADRETAEDAATAALSAQRTSVTAAAQASQSAMTSQEAAQQAQKAAQDAQADVTAEAQVRAAADAALGEAIAAKQDKLVAGQNITIFGNVISATGGGGGETDLSAYRKAADQDVIDAGKMAKGESYTKAESDAKYLTAHQSLAAYRTAAAQDAIDSRFLTEHQDISGKMDSFTVGAGLSLSGGVLSLDLPVLTGQSAF